MVETKGLSCLSYTQLMVKKTYHPGGLKYYKLVQDFDVYRHSFMTSILLTAGGPDWGSIGHDQILKNHKAHEADNEFERPPLASASHILRMKIFGATLEKINIEPRNLNPSGRGKKHIYTPPWFELTILSSVLKPLGLCWNPQIHTHVISSYCGPEAELLNKNCCQFFRKRAKGFPKISDLLRGKRPDQIWKQVELRL